MTPARANTIQPHDASGLHLAMISDFMPRHDASSSNFRVYNLLKMLDAWGCRVTYFYCAPDPADADYAARFGPKIRFRQLPLDAEQMQQAVAAISPNAVWLTNLWNIDFVGTMTRIAMALAELPARPRLIADTMDFHAKKHLRRHRLSGDTADLALAQRFLELEQVLYGISDAVLTVSEEERHDILQNVPGCAPVSVIPNVHPVSEAPTDPAGREGMAFLGNYAVQHNVDAVQHFAAHILPAILTKKPGARLHLLGRGAAERLGHLAGENIVCEGFVPDVDEALARHRVFVCPMPYGAGMKGKVGSAAACGLPVVTTSIGAEGFPFKDGEHCFIADDPALFALKILLLLDNDADWGRLSENSRTLLAERFGINAVSRRLAELITPLQG